MFERVADHGDPGSLASRMRRARFERFGQLVRACPGAADAPVRVLDVGGDPEYWRDLDLLGPRPVEVVLLNLHVHAETGDPRISSCAGDARDLAAFGDASFDLAHANSVLEHVGGQADQRRMASEMRRVGRGYFVQTPNRGFPIEPHFVLPFFHYLPVSARQWIARVFRPGWYRSRPVAAAIADARDIRLLTRADLAELFPDGRIWPERVWGLTKSWVVYRVPV